MTLPKQKPNKDRLTPSQTRAARRMRKDRRRKFIRLLGLGGIAAIALLFIVGLFLPSLPIAGQGGIFGGGVPDGPGMKLETQGSTHIESGQSHPSYNSIPATSGWHYDRPLAPVRWGIHTEFVSDEYRVHNLEHGGIGIHYNCPDGCDELVRQLADIVELGRDEGMKILLSPYPGMETTIALTAWTFIDKFDVFDRDRITDFINTHESSPTAPEANAR